MILTKETKLKINRTQANIIGHLCYSAYKHWNVLNYEKMHYHELGIEQFPDAYYQMVNHKDDFFARNLPSQTAREVANILDKSWKSYFVLCKRGGKVKNLRPPRFKQDKIPVTYLKNAIVHNECNIRLALPKQLKEFMKKEYGIDDNFLFLSNPVFEDITSIKQIKLYPPTENDECKCIVIYEVEDSVVKEDNGNYLSIDLGIDNLMTCYSNKSGESFIAGRMYFSIARKYIKEIQRVQSIWSKIQKKNGVEYPKSSKHIQKLYDKKNKCTSDYLHKVTRNIVEYCISNNINTVVVGDMKGIRKNFDRGVVLNQKLHSLPFNLIVNMLTYKLKREGISLICQKEYYTSQCSPLSESVSKQCASPNKRVKRGLFIDGDNQWNADSVAAYNILRLYAQTTKKEIHMQSIQTPYVLKVAL